MSPRKSAYISSPEEPGKRGKKGEKGGGGPQVTLEDVQLLYFLLERGGREEKGKKKGGKGRAWLSSQSS